MLHNFLILVQHLLFFSTVDCLSYIYINKRLRADKEHVFEDEDDIIGGCVVVDVHEDEIPLLFNISCFNKSIAHSFT